MRRILAAALLAALLPGCEGFDIVGPPATGIGPRPPALLGDFETADEFAKWRAAAVWGRRAEGALSLSDEHVTSGEKSLVVKVAAGRSVSVSLAKLPADWGPYESLAFDIFTPKIGGVEEWVPFALFVENTQSADWFTRVHHDSRLGIVSGRRSTVELPLREIRAYNLKRERFGVARVSGGFDGIEAPMGMLSGPFDVTTIAGLELRFQGVGADRTFYIDNVRLTNPPNFEGGVARTPAMVRVGSPYRFVSFDLNKGGSLRDLLGGPVGVEFRYARSRHEWYSSSAGTNHARIQIVERTPERLRLRVQGGCFGPWPRPGVDLGSRASFEYVVEQAAGERFPSVRIDAAFERTGPALEGIESLELVWCCGQSPVVAGAEMKPGEWTSGKAFIAGSRLAFGGKRWLAIVSEKGVKARYVPSFNGGHELRIPLPIVRGGRIGQGDEYKITFSLQSVL